MESNKRILVLNYEFPPLGGGASPMSYEVSQGLAKLGYKVDVVTMAYKDLPHYEEQEGMCIYRVPCIRTKKEICHPWEQLSFIISAEKFLKKHLKEHKYDLVHCHFIVPTGVIALWIKEKFAIPYILTSHGSDVLGYNTKRGFKYMYPLIRNIWKKIVKEAKVVVTPSLFLQERIKEHTSQGKFVVIPNGIEKGKFVPMKKENRIITVARLFENKGVQDLIKAISNKSTKEMLLENRWTVDIVGEGPYKKVLEDLAKELGVLDMVNFHGWVDNNSTEMKELYGKTKIFVSGSWFESFGLTALEAMCAGCYPLLSDIPGYKQFDLDNRNYFQLKNSKGLSKRIENLLMKEQYRTPVDVTKFYWENILNKYNKVISE